MRILQVSAHLPPDFVSGGALVPHRFAHELRKRGHESFIFAGRLNDVRPLEVRDEDDDGVPVRWIGNSAFIGWGDRKNFDHPEIASRFEEYLLEVDPDIVHFHSIQTLGAQMLDIAKSHGYPTVVTMHDFWWVCARQFLVDRDGEPCPLVVSCGECECEAGREHLENRNEWLAKRLESADLVLFPSASARDVLVANGVPREKTAVNENGIDVTESDVKREELPFVRFMYTGGDAEMKGYEVLKKAAQLAKVVPGTMLDLYNTPAEGFPSWAQHQPRYGRDELPEVFAGHDVLILPSVMRESHSIVTREALRAGLAVIATDSIGPEEAINHGTNGMIVRSADPVDLARAIEKMSDPEVTRPMLNQGSASKIVSVDEQIDQIEDLYTDLLAGEGSSKAAVRDGVRTLIRNVLIVIGIQGAAGRYRAHFPAEGLRMRGVEPTILHFNSPLLEQEALDADAVVFYRVPATYRVLDVVKKIRESDRIIPIVGDVDDLIFDPDIVATLDNLNRLDDAERELWIRGVHRYRTTFEQCDYFIGSTELISAEAERLLGVPAQRFHNGVGALLARVSERALNEPRSEGSPRIGFFSGTDTHDADWASIEGAIARVLDSHPEVELWLGGLVEPTEVLAPYEDRIKRLPFVPWHELPTLLRDVDICLAPLTADSHFNEAKSAIKWLEAALVETPTVASPSQPFVEAIRPEQTGMIAAKEDEWVDALTALLDDPALRDRMGRAAKRQALLERSPDMQGWAYLNILIDAWLHVAEHGHKESSTFPPVVDDEMADPTAGVEPYTLSAQRSGPAGIPALVRVRQLAQKGVHSLRTEGMRPTVRKVVGKIQGRL